MLPLRHVVRHGGAPECPSAVNTSWAWRLDDELARYKRSAKIEIEMWGSANVKCSIGW
jgi:hypothetical protein